MIHSILITNHLGESLELELRFPEKSGFLIKNVDGLYPVKATINTTELATRDGTLYNSSRLTYRNIVFDFIFYPNLSISETIEDIRLKSYKYFSIKEKVYITITTDRRVCMIEGYVEANDVNIFSSQESSQISIICPNPNFSSLDNTIFNYSAEVSLFEFPFSNEDVNTPLLEVSELLLSDLANIVYTGDVETGLIFYIHAIGPVEDLSIVNEKTSGVFKINTTLLEALTGDGIIAGDDITISTIKGNKYALLLRDGEYINILNAVEEYPEWFTLTKSDNVFGFIAVSGIENLQFRLEYPTLYEGI